jgi:hypothetical protein
VAVVNAQFARHYWPQQDALGKRSHLQDATGPPVEIVGIAETGKYVWISESPLDFLYLPYTQHGTRALKVLAESNAPDAAILAPVLGEVVRKIDPAMPYSDARTMQDFFTQRAVKTTNINRRGGRRSWADGPGASHGWAVRTGGVLGEPAFAGDWHSHGDWAGVRHESGSQAALRLPSNPQSER